MTSTDESPGESLHPARLALICLGMAVILSGLAIVIREAAVWYTDTHGPIPPSAAVIYLLLLTLGIFFAIHKAEEETNEA